MANKYQSPQHTSQKSISGLADVHRLEKFIYVQQLAETELSRNFTNSSSQITSSLYMKQSLHSVKTHTVKDCFLGMCFSQKTIKHIHRCTNISIYSNMNIFPSYTTVHTSINYYFSIVYSFIFSQLVSYYDQTMH